MKVKELIKELQKHDPPSRWCGSGVTMVTGGEADHSKSNIHLPLRGTLSVQC